MRVGISQLNRVRGLPLRLMRHRLPVAADRANRLRVCACSRNERRRSARKFLRDPLIERGRFVQ